MMVAGRRIRQGKLSTGKAQRAERARRERVPRIVRLADVAAQEVKWLWYPYIPRGKITLLEGDPGVGKSYLALQLCAIVSRGRPWPGTDGQPGCRRKRESAVVLNCDDGLRDTIRPRLDKAEADLRHVSAIDGLSDGSEITLADVDMLESVLAEIGPVLVVVDPVQGFLGHINTHSANEVRPILAGLGGLAERYTTAIVCVRHLRKKGASRALYRGMGSIDFTAAARSVLLAGETSGDPTQKAIVHLKSSLAPRGATIGYTLDNGGFRWTGKLELTASDLLRPEASAEDRAALDEAREFLLGILVEGSKSFRYVLKQARDAGITVRTLRRAKSDLGVKSERESTGNQGAGVWTWSLSDGHVLKDRPDTPE
jgi:hypothetical protein